MTTIYFIRHATNDLVNKAIAGWTPGVHLNNVGQEQAEHLAEQFSPGLIQQIYSSPLERALETATPIAKKAGLKIQIAHAIGEIQFGEWTGKSFADLKMDPQWETWNVFRTGARIPGGETMLEVQERTVTFIQSLCQSYPGDTIALVSHGDPIRAALLCYLGMPLDFVHRFEISPASVSILSIGDTGARVMMLNHVPGWKAGSWE